MKAFFEVKISVAVLAVVFTLGLAGPIAVHAATSPSLGMAETFGILASTYTNVASGTIIGDIGYTTPPVTPTTVSGTIHVADATYNQAGIDQGTALTNLEGQVCDFNFGADTDLSLLSQPLTPGKYCITGAMSIGTAGITLRGTGTYIFRSTGALTTVMNSEIFLEAGACSMNIFWTPLAATTLGANSTFRGTIIDDSGITIGSTVTLDGRALAFAETVTSNVDIITVPTVCIAAPSGAGPDGTINVVKTVINDSGRTNVVADFPLFVNGTPVVSGETNIFTALRTYEVTETPNSNYTRTFSGDCDASGQMILRRHDALFCIVTNNDIGAPLTSPPVPPLIDVVKVPSPLALPAGPGPVTYTYTLRNVGTVPVTDVTMVGDSCSPIILESGDTDSDARLDLTETWIYRCSKTVSATHTNTVVATGWANGLSATDIANATVVVGLPVVPPLIHVTKIPSPLTLPAGGGMVTYTKRVTNPGTVALSDVWLTDDKCSSVQYVSGDTNSNSKLDTTETWIYSCQTNLTATTINTVTASGIANGMIARDVAVATVVVPSAVVAPAVVPALPNTGLSPEGKNTPWNIIVLSGLLILASASLAVILRKRTI